MMTPSMRDGERVGTGRHEGRLARWAATIVALSLVAGCAVTRSANVRLEHWDPNYGYRPQAVADVRPLGDVLLVLAFSGGGTRAAAFSYGVLQELRDTRVVVGGREVRLLDEVDLISSVSGGSFTSAYYALFGDRIFSEFEERFLRRDVEGHLLLELLRPFNWFRLATTLDRTELAIEFYDRTIFERATFADVQAARGPFVQINAADIGIGNHFTFFQPQFDLICSDLSKYRVSRAVAASSAVPGLFAALTVRNHAGTCGFEMPAWVEDAERDRMSSPRRYRAARMMQSYVDGKRPFIHLVDGGVADNLGLRGPLDNVLLRGGLDARLEQLGGPRPSHVAVIVVNAEVHPQPSFNLTAAAPSLFGILNAVTDTQIYSYNFETLELMRESLRAWGAAMSADGSGRPVEVYTPEVTFEALPEARDRDFFNDVPTSFDLPDATVDRLIAAGRSLLRDSPDFQRLVHALPQSGAVDPNREGAKE
jgi:NTE family protein